jgi:hypothetical protein
MTELLLDLHPLANQPEPLLASPAPEPSREVDARVRRLAHAALRASHSPARMTRLESALSSALVVCYAVYAASQIVVILQRG